MGRCGAQKRRDAELLAGLPILYPGEQEAIETVKELGSRYGYGNLISHLADAWSEHLQASGISKRVADTAAGHICVWCHVDSRLGSGIG